MLEGVTEEIKKQAEQRINRRFIMYVRGLHQLALKITQRGRRLRKEHSYGTIVERYREDEQYQCVCKNKDTHNLTWKNLTESDTNARSYNPTKEAAATP